MRPTCQLIICVAHAALEGLALRRHGNVNVPDLAFRTLAMSSVRHVACHVGVRDDGVYVGPTGEDLLLPAAAVITFLQEAPVNISRLMGRGPQTNKFLDVVAALGASQCHTGLTHLAVDMHDGVTDFGAVLLAATRGLAALRAIRMVGDNAAVIAAVRATVRRVAVTEDTFETFDAAEYPRLRHLVVHDCRQLRTVSLPPVVARQLRSCDIAGCRFLTALDMRHAVLLRRLPDGFLACCASLVSVDLPPSLTQICAGAFHDCASLEALHLGHTSISTIEDSIAYDGLALTSVSLPSSLRLLHEHAFRGCEALAYLDLSHTHLVSAQESFMDGCTALQSVRLPATLEALGAYAFNNCTALSAVDLSRTQMLRVEDNFCTGCISLRSFVAPMKCRTVGFAAFSNCTSMAHVDLSDTQIYEIEEEFMAGAEQLSSVVLPAALASLGPGANYAVRRAWQSALAVRMPR
jgi:hypothetical protein